MSDNPTFSKAYEELQALTAEFEKGDLDLEKAIPKFKRASELAKLLKQKLSVLENQIEEINIELEKEATTPKAPDVELNQIQEDIAF
jgi:exodeoxyribonuclease VII small subunit